MRCLHQVNQTAVCCDTDTLYLYMYAWFVLPPPTCLVGVLSCHNNNLLEYL